MLERLQELDRNLFIYLNSLGNPLFDGFWLVATKQLHWAPVFLIIFYLIFKKKGWKNGLMILLFIALLVLVGDQFTNLIKYAVQRIRPCNNPDLVGVIRILHTTPTFSFFSGHATNSMATTLFVYLILKKHFKYVFLLFLWPLIFAYSRIYIGVHYPGDILAGYVVGATFGFAFYKLYRKTEQKYFPDSF
ncbi:phosphatase PAP2 family protein [Flavobacterium sp.]|uniref:phosphatase PAP2 family protein n=1 Tax=Flavobacterium sp. TaxID=239 RepID=UPI003D6A6303